MSTGPFGSGSFGTGVFANTPFYNTKTLIDEILRATSHSTPDRETAKRAVVLAAINNRYAFVTTKQHWNWLYQEVDFLFKEPYAEGTVSLTKGSQSVVGVGTAFTANAEQNNILSVVHRNETYLISSVETGEALTLEGRFAGEDQDDVACKIIKSIYTMPSDLESVQSILVDNVGELLPKGTQEFARIKASDTGRTGAPRFFTEVGRRQADGVRLIEVYPAPDRHYTARLHYGVNVMRLTDSIDSSPLIPGRHRMILFYGALADFARNGLRDTVLAGENDSLFWAALTNMLNDKQLTDSRVQIQPLRNYRNRRARRGQISYSTSDFAKEE